MKVFDKDNLDNMKSEESLTTKVTKGGAWLILARLTVRVVGIVVTMILARLLSPDDYGVVAVGLLTISLLHVLTEVGLRQALVQKRVDINPFLDTAWTVGLIRGSSMSLVIVLIAPGVTAFFDLPQATNVVRGLAIYPLLQSLVNIRILYLQKELDFRRLFFYEISALIGPLVVGIGLAVLLQNAWALVWSQLASIVIQVVVSYWMFPVLPRLQLNWGYAKEMFGFGKWVWWGGIFLYGAMQGDTYFVGKFFDAASLGMYTMAYRVSSIPVNEVKRSLVRVLFPVYAKIGADTPRVKKSMLNAYEALTSIMLPACVLLGLVADDFVFTVLGDRWKEMIPLLKILCIAAAFRAIIAAGSGYFLGIGKPHISFCQSAIRCVVLLVVLYPLAKYWGLAGVGIAAVISNFTVIIHWFLYLNFVEGFRVSDWSSRLGPICLALIVMVLVVCGIQFLLVPGMLRLGVSCISGLISYIVTLFLIWHIFFPSSQKILKVQIEKIIQPSLFRRTAIE